MANITFTEGSGLQDSIYGKSQAPIRLFIEKHGEAFEATSVAKAVFAEQKSLHWAEKTTGMTSMDGFLPVGENGAYPVDGMQEGYEKTFEHMTWKNSFSISREMVEDSKIMDLKRQPQAFVTSYYRTREKFAAALLGAAIRKQTSVTFCGKVFDTKSADGVCLFSTAHPPKVKGTNQSNLFADAFSNDALMAAEERMQNMTDDRGNVLDIAPDTILIPNQYALKKAVFAAIGADKDPATANNGFNYNFGRWNVIVWPYLNGNITSGTSPWVLMDSRYNKDYGGALWFDRTGLEVKSLVDDGSDANVWHGYSRFIAGFSDFRFAACGGVTGGTQMISD
ncbi:MAG: hypothetical protein IKQ92_10405 [Clostridia bacterium]|nr:hypothetical protein [Clostridia bacterium]